MFARFFMAAWSCLCLWPGLAPGSSRGPAPSYVPARVVPGPATRINPRNSGPDRLTHRLGLASTVAVSEDPFQGDD
jgi:hypothetical protein